MIPNDLTSLITGNIKLPKYWKNHCVFQGLIARILFTFILILSFTAPSVSLEAMPIITNTATANYTVNGNNLNLSDSVQFTKDTVVTPTDNINLSKTVNTSSAVIGSTLTYTLTVQNPNPRILTNVIIQDNLPTGLIYIANSARLNNVAVNASQISSNTGSLVINLGDIPANTNWSVSYKTNVSTATPTGNATNKAIAISDTVTSSQAQSNVTINQPIVIVPVTPLIPLVLSKDASNKEVKIGENISYTLTIKNNNSRSVSGTIVKDLLPAGLDYLAGSARVNNNTISVDETNGLSFIVGDINAGSTALLTYEATVTSIVDNTRTLINSANVIADDPKANSNTSSATVNIVNDTLKLTKTTSSTSVTNGDIVEYTVTLTNPLNRNLSNLTFKDSLPSGFVYQSDSLKVNENLLTTDAVEVTGNDLNVKIGSLEASTSIVLTYKVKVNEEATPGEAINKVVANSDFAESPIATAMVKVRTPSTINFLKINETGVSSIIQSTSFNSNKDGGKFFEDIENISLPNGSIVKLPIEQPIVEADQYTLGEPIVIEVIDLDQNIDSERLETIIVTVSIPGTNDTEILLLTETSINSGIFRGVIMSSTDNTNVQDGILSIAEGDTINVNYRDEEDSTDTSASAALIIPDTSLQIRKQADKDYSAIGELVRYSLEFSNTTGFNLNNLKVHDLLPIGFRYIPDSAELNGSRLNDKVTFNGRSLTFDLINMPVASTWTISYVTKVSAGVQIGEAINTVYLTSGSLRSNKAQATVTIKDDLMRSQNILTGRVYIGCKTKSDKNEVPPEVLGEARIYLETGRSALTDKEGFWHMEGVYPGAHVVQLDTESIPGYEPLLCDDNTRRAKDAKSHFVDLQPGNLWNVDFHVKQIDGYVKSTETLDKKTGTKDPFRLYGKEYLKTAPEGFEILWPKNNYVPAIGSINIFIKNSPQHKVEVILNGKKVSPLNYDGSNTNKKRTVAVRRWKGVDIDVKRKNNTLLVILKDKSGKEISRKTHNIHFSTNPVSAQLLKDKSVLIADGKTTPVIALLIKDEEGFPLRANTNGYFTLENSKYRIKTQNTNEETINDLNETNTGRYKYQIEEGGIARIELNPTTQSGEIKLNLEFSSSGKNYSGTNNKSTKISAWLKPALREWIMVGIAEGTLAHKRLSGNMQALKDLDKSDKFSKRGRVAFFAKGQVKGKYLLTAAYDTHKQDREVGSQLNGNIDPDAFYTIYADNSNSQYDAPSSEKLYLKIEKDSFYALYGDYQTDMTITELANYQRTLNGINTEYQGERFSFKGFISETSNNHHHEEIPGDGTSGLYYLKDKIIPNSETISIETRDRFRSDKIIETRQLSRYQDYNIDYEEGTLFFKFPISSRDRDFNPNIIVVDYDSEENTNKSITAGGRIAVKTKNDKLETGISFIHEGKNNSRDNQLIAADSTYKITPDTEVHIEVAQSKTEASDFQKRQAYIIELEKEIENMETRVFYKKQESGFGIDSQNSENGSEKIGAELDFRVNEKTTLNSEVSLQKNLENDNKRRLAKFGVSHQIKQYQVDLGYRHTQEDLEGEDNSKEILKSDTLLLGGQYTTKNNKVTLRTDLEKNISAKNGSEISPDRMIVGVDVKLAQGFSVFAEHETTDNGELKTHNNRVGISKDLWKGAKTKTTYTQERTDEGQRNYATLGLSQTVKLTDNISADFSVDQAKTIGDSANQKSFNEDEPVIQGSESDDYTAFTVGLGSNTKDWSWTSRAEYRNGELNDKINFLASIIRNYENGKNLSAQLSYYNSEHIDGDFDKDIKLSFGSAWHPKEKDFVFFSRLDLISEKSSSTTNDSENAFANINNNDAQKIVHNLHYNRKINEKTKIGIHHGIKYVKDENDGVKSTSTIDTATVELRRDINKRWDVGLHGGYLRDWTDKAIEYVAGVSVGFNPKENIWVELGYNVEGFTDEDFDNNNYTSEGVYADFRYKFNQDTLKGDLPYRRTAKTKDENDTKNNNKIVKQNDVTQIN
ncbi:hypothetical protein [uncultured Cocleimonas sp.]|uniref:hypothetical protein n=1 Tax=uncultured Cocleimonas sp. TaxID=1051587 RepID=UPI0026256D66|nr:hypothetical protein [uncultured Cocleimonas sp.]